MGTDERARWPLAVLSSAVAAGLMFSASASTSRGEDLRASGGDVSSVVKERTKQINARRAEARRLQREIDALAGESTGGSTSGTSRTLSGLRRAGGLKSVTGAGLRIELSDTPRNLDFPGVNPNLLVVHQQDIQAFVNALWAGGARAIALQGQRLVSISGIKCVGNTVVIDGVPYSPPYVIEAVGDASRLRTALDQSPEVQTYRTYATDYQLGLAEDEQSDLRIEPYSGPISFRFAKPLLASRSQQR